MRAASVVVLVLLLLTLSTPRAFAAERPREGPTKPNNGTTRVFVTHAGTDHAGVAFVAALREALRRSERYALAVTEAEANVLLVVASAAPGGEAHTASAVSLAYVANNEWRSLLGSSAKFVGQTRAVSMGRATVNELSAVLAAYDPTGAP